MREIFLGMLGLCMGTTIASGVVAFIISLGFSFSDGRSITEKMINPGIKPGSPEDTECVRNEKQKKTGKITWI